MSAGISKSRVHNRIHSPTPYLCLKSRLSTIIFSDLITYCLIIVFEIWAISNLLNDQLNLRGTIYDVRWTTVSVDLSNIESTQFSHSTNKSLALIRNSTLAIMETARVNQAELINATISNAFNQSELTSVELLNEFRSMMVSLNQTVYGNFNDSISKLQSVLLNEGMYIENLTGGIAADYNAINELFSETLTKLNSSNTTDTISKMEPLRYMDDLSSIYAYHSLQMGSFFKNLSRTAYSAKYSYSQGPNKPNYSNSTILRQEPSMQAQMRKRSVCEYSILAVLISIVIVLLLIWNWIKFRYEVDESDGLQNLQEYDDDILVIVHHIADPLVYHISQLQSSALFSLKYNKSLNFPWLNSMLFGRQSNLLNLLKFTLFTGLSSIIGKKLIDMGHLGKITPANFNAGTTFGINIVGNADISSTVAWAYPDFVRLVDRFISDVNLFFKSNFESELNIDLTAFNMQLFNQPMYELSSLGYPMDSQIVSMTLKSSVSIPLLNSQEAIAAVLRSFHSCVSVTGYLSIVCGSIWCCYCLACCIYVTYYSY